MLGKRSEADFLPRRLTNQPPTILHIAASVIFLNYKFYHAIPPTKTLPLTFSTNIYCMPLMCKPNLLNTIHKSLLSWPLPASLASSHTSTSNACACSCVCAQTRINTCTLSLNPASQYTIPSFSSESLYIQFPQLKRSSLVIPSHLTKVCPFFESRLRPCFLWEVIPDLPKQS